MDDNDFRRSSLGDGKVWSEGDPCGCKKVDKHLYINDYEISMSIKLTTAWGPEAAQPGLAYWSLTIWQNLDYTYVNLDYTCTQKVTSGNVHKNWTAIVLYVAESLRGRNVLQSNCCSLFYIYSMLKVNLTITNNVAMSFYIMFSIIMAIITAIRRVPWLAS